MVKHSMKNYFNGIVLAIIIILLPAYFVTRQYRLQNTFEGYGDEIIQAFSNNKDGNFIVIDKGDFTLSVFKNFKKYKEYEITIGKNPGNKREPGDDRTPEGIFRIKSLEKVLHWAYDFPEDTLPPVVGAYGPWFIRLDVPGFEGIGIHGFINDDWLGKRKSNGCIRLNNKQLNKLVTLVKPGMLVIIIPSKEDIEYDLQMNDIAIREPNQEIHIDSDL